MAQRRSRNRRLSRRSNNVSGYLDDNTNIIDNNDPQWYNRTIVRPSTSFALTENASSILNPDSAVDETELTNNWYNNLSRSQSSNLMEEIVKSKINNQNNESKENTHVEPITESESETESQRKRANLRVSNKKANVSDKSNVFLKALEKTTESHTRNLTTHIPEGYESESTNDDSKTIRRIRPALFRKTKPSKENISDFDNLFHSSSITENIRSNTRDSRSSLKRKGEELTEHPLTAEVTEKFKKTQLEKLNEINATEIEKSNAHVNISSDKTVLVTPIRELRNRSITTHSKSQSLLKSSQKKVNSETLYDPVDMSLTMVQNKSQKKRAALFTENSKNNLNEKNDKSSSDPEIFEKTKANVPESISDDEYGIYDKPNSSNSVNAQTSSQTLNTSKKSKKSNISSQKSKSEISIDENKSRSRLLRSRTRISDGDNAFDKILDNENSATSEKSNLTSNEQRSIRSLESKKSLQDQNSSKNHSRSASKSILGQSKNISQISKSVENENIHINSQQESDNEILNMPNYISRTRSRLFQRSEIAENNAFDEILNIENSENKLSKSNKSISQKSLSLKLAASQNSSQVSERNISLLRDFRKSNLQDFKKPRETHRNIESSKASDSSESLKENQDTNKSEKMRARKSNTSLNKSKETINESGLMDTEKSNISKNLTSTGYNMRKQTSQQSKTSDLSIEKNAVNKDDLSQHSSVETSSDETPFTKSNKNKTIPHTSEKSVNEDYLSDDLLHTPNPAQSTLKITGKPITRITQFLFRNSLTNEMNSFQSPNTPIPNTPLNPKSPATFQEKKANNEGKEGVEIDVTNDSDISESLILTRDPNDIPQETQSSTDEEAELFLSSELSTSKTKQTQIAENASAISESVWAEMKKKTDAMKIIMETQKKKQEAVRQEREREKARIDAKFKRATAQREAELKKQRKKPINEAYYVDGKPYKQPKLPTPKKWVTDRLYKYLWKHMEPKFGMSTRVRSEKFVKKFCDLFDIIMKRKKFQNYEAELDDLIQSMAKLGIIVNRYDFYTFCREFMPPKFREKVVPSLLPGNIRNIPYDENLLYKPIL